MYSYSIVPGHQKLTAKGLTSNTIPELGFSYCIKILVTYSVSIVVASELPTKLKIRLSLLSKLLASALV